MRSNRIECRQQTTKNYAGNRVEPAKCGGGELSDLSAGVEMGVLRVVIITLSLRKNTSLVRHTEVRRHFHDVPRCIIVPTRRHRTRLGCVKHAIVTRKSATQPLSTLHSSLGTWARCSIVITQVHPRPASPGKQHGYSSEPWRHWRRHAMHRYHLIRSSPRPVYPPSTQAAVVPCHLAGCSWVASRYKASQPHASRTHDQFSHPASQPPSARPCPRPAH